MHSAATTIPRLISVVEIVKREYLKTLDPALAQSGKLSGLHQYNHIGELEQPDGPEGALGPEERRQREITLALSGKRQCVSPRLSSSRRADMASVRQHKVPYMKVTLSRKELPDLIPAGASHVLPHSQSHLSDTADLDISNPKSAPCPSLPEPVSNASSKRPMRPLDRWDSSFPLLVTTKRIRERTHQPVLFV